MSGRDGVLCFCSVVAKCSLRSVQIQYLSFFAFVSIVMLPDSSSIVSLSRSLALYRFSAVCFVWDIVVLCLAVSSHAFIVFPFKVGAFSKTDMFS